MSFIKLLKPGEMWDFEIRFVRDLTTRRIDSRHILRYVVDGRPFVLIRIEEKIRIHGSNRVYDKLLSIEFPHGEKADDDFAPDAKYEKIDNLYIFTDGEMLKQIKYLQREAKLLKRFPEGQYHYYSGLLSFENEVC